MEWISSQVKDTKENALEDVLDSNHLTADQEGMKSQISSGDTTENEPSQENKSEENIENYRDGITIIERVTNPDIITVFDPQGILIIFILTSWL